MSVDEARSRLARLETQEAVLDRDTRAFAACRRHRPLSDRIRAAQVDPLAAARRLSPSALTPAGQERLRRGQPVAAAHFRRASRASPPAAEVAQAQALDDRRERIEGERQQAVLALVAAGRLFSGHPAIRQCYWEARRLANGKFLKALGNALAIVPNADVDEHAQPVTNRNARMLADAETAATRRLMLRTPR